MDKKKIIYIGLAGFVLAILLFGGYKGYQNNTFKKGLSEANVAIQNKEWAQAEQALDSIANIKPLTSALSTEYLLARTLIAVNSQEINQLIPLEGQEPLQNTEELQKMLSLSIEHLKQQPEQLATLENLLHFQTRLTARKQYRENQSDKAIQTLTEHYEKSPDYKTAADLGIFHLKQNKPVLAKSWLDKSNSEKTNYKSLFYLGMMAHEEKNTEHAKIYLSHAYNLTQQQEFNGNEFIGDVPQNHESRLYKALGEIFEQSNSISLASRFYKNAALLAPEDFNDDYLYKLTLDQALSDLSTIKFYLQENRATHEVKPSDKCFDGENCVQHTYSWISASEEYCDNLKNTSTDRLNLSEKQNFYLNLKTISMCDRPFLYGITLNKRGEVFEETLISSNFYIHNLKNLYFLELAGASIDEIKAAQGKTAASKTRYLTDPEGNILNAFIRNRFLGAKKLNTEEKSFVENIIFLGSEQKITKNHVNRQLSTVLLDAEAETDKNSNERMGKVATRIHHTKPKQPESISIEAFLPELLKQPFPDQDSSAKNTLAISESSDSDRSPKSNKPQNQQTNSKTDLSGAASTNSGLIHGVIQKWQDIKR